MTRFVAIVSGKGGVGKTTTALNLGTALNNHGKDVILVDGSLTTPNIGLRLGSSKIPVTLHDVFENNKSILSAIYKHSSGLKIIPGDISLDAFHKVNTKKLIKSMNKLRGASDIVIIDSGAGLSKENLALVNAADELLIVTTPEIAAVTDALRSIKLAERKNKTILGVVLNRINNDSLEMSVDSVETMLGIPVIAELPESDDIRESQQAKQPVVYFNPKSEISLKYNQLAQAILGEEKIEKHTSWILSLLEKVGLK